MNLLIVWQPKGVSRHAGLTHGARHVYTMKVAGPKAISSALRLMKQDVGGGDEAPGLAAVASTDDAALVTSVECTPSCCVTLTSDCSWRIEGPLADARL